VILSIDFVHSLQYYMTLSGCQNVFKYESNSDNDFLPSERKKYL